LAIRSEAGGRGREAKRKWKAKMERIFKARREVGEGSEGRKPNGFG
jgi:hypothetical protein